MESILMDRVRAGIAALLCVFVVMFPLKIYIASGVYVPNVSAICLVLFLLLNRSIDAHDFLVVCFLLLVFILFVFFNLVTSVNSVPVLEKVKSCLYLLFNVTVSCIYARCFCRLRLDWRFFENMLLVLGIGIALYATFESGTVLGRISDTVRIYLHGGGNLYDMDKRDMDIAGRVRPKVFTAEPAHGAFVLMMSMGLVVVRASCYWQLLAACLVALWGAWAFQSLVGFALVVGLLSVAFLRLMKWWGVRLSTSLPVVCVCFAVLGLAAFVFVPTVNERVLRFTENRDSGTDIRTTYQVKMAGMALERNPVSGLGFGGERELAIYFHGNNRTYKEKTESLVSNAIASIPLFSGLSGVLFFGIGYALLLYKLPKGYRLAFALLSLLPLNATGSIASTVVWLTSGLVISNITQIERCFNE